MAGASATATAAAWANRLLAPMTKVSKVYFGLSRVSSTCSGSWLPGRGRRAPGTWTRPGMPSRSGRGGSGSGGAGVTASAVELVLTDVEVVDLAAAVGDPQVVAASSEAVSRAGAVGQGGVDGDGEPHVAAELACRGSAVTRSRSRVSTMSLVKSLGTAMRAVSSSRPTSRASERKALCCTGIPSESRTSRVVRHSCGHRRVRHSPPPPSAARRAVRLRPDPGSATPSTWLSTDCGYAAWSPRVCRSGRRAVLRAILWRFPESGVPLPRV